MRDFIRPATNAVTSPSELTVGTKLYHVYGIWPPFLAAQMYTVVLSPIPYDQHPKKQLSDPWDSLVFDTVRGHHREMHFCSDGNVGKSTNHNWWFKSKDDAEKYLAQCREDWENHPEEIKRVQDRRRQDAFDSLHDVFCDGDST